MGSPVLVVVSSYHSRWELSGDDKNSSRKTELHNLSQFTLAIEPLR